MWLLALCALSPSLYAEFGFQKGDRIVYIGNALPDRMQHDGWLETLLQAGAPDKELVVRNLGFVGDQVAHRPRNKGFDTPEVYLDRCDADVIFVFFGYNESFEGNKGVEQFKASLAKMIDDYRALKPNGKSEPRFVLFSPIAHENLEDPNLPDGKANNRRLHVYALATAEVAAAKSAGFVDLFAATQKLYKEAKEPLTINGVHLNEEGNRRVAEVIAEQLLGRKVAASGDLESLRQAVLDKNWHWFNRYRAADGNDIWGTRSVLTFVDGQSNADVLQHELTMLDVMTANRDTWIHGLARGEDVAVDDSNVPQPVPVISNVGGGSKSSNAMKEGNLDYISGKKGIDYMTVPEGFEVNLFADEAQFPELVNPVQMQVDTKGRLWVAAWKTYPKWEPLQEMDDRLIILPDEDKDGVADKAITFAKVHNPLGFEFWNGGVIVTTQPDILFLKDTDGDDVADVRYVLFQGLGSSDTHHAANNLLFGPDGGIYWQSGIFLQHNHEHPWGPSLESQVSGMYRFDPRRYTISFIAKNSPNPHGTSFDYWGYLYANDGTGGRSYQVRPSKDGFEMHELLTKEVRPVAADAIVSSANFPEEMQQNFLVCNTIGFLGIKQYELHRDGYSLDTKVTKTVKVTNAEGKTEKKEVTENVVKKFKPGEVWGTPTEEMLSSTDKNFRPTDAVFGEDGGLYVSDWHNVIIGHMQHNIRDPNRDHQHGRIYRIIYKDRPLQEPVAIDGEPIEELLNTLKHPIDGVRHQARVELSERDSKEVIAATDEWVKQFDPGNSDHAHHLLEALWLHQQHNVRDEELLETVENSPVVHARNAAAMVRQHWFVADPATMASTGPMVEEEEKVEVEIPEHLAADAHSAYRLGAEVFSRDAHCITCHQPNGQGLPNIYPPLTSSPWVTGSEERLIKLTLHGLWGPIEVNGQIFDPTKGVPPMTAFGALLTDEEVAGVLTYVRNTWGNQAPAIDPAKVKQVREAHKDRFVFWKPEELLKDHPLE